MATKPTIQFAARLARAAAICIFWLARSVAGAEELHDQIDSAISAKAGGTLAARSSDGEFLRRAYLSLAGEIPTTAEARQFLADTAADKRIKLIDRLLESPSYARRMDEAFTVMLLERRAAALAPPQDWSAFLRSSLAANKPWDQLVREIVAADGLDPATAGAVKFFADSGRENPDQITRDVARLFLGMDLQCAHCHDHPLIKDFKQADYFGLFAFLKPTRPLAHPKTKQAVLTEAPLAGKVDFESVFVPGARATGPRLPGGKEFDVPTFDKGQEFEVPAADGVPGVPKFHPRALLAAELTAPANTQFARTSVNRFWFLMMGRGLVHPLELDHSDNPPSHPELLVLMADEFVKHRFDIKWLLREIALSESFGRASIMPDGVRPDEVRPESYRVAIAQPLSPEQLTWSFLQATGNMQMPDGDANSKFAVTDYLTGVGLTGAEAVPPASKSDVRQLLIAIFGSPAGEAEVGFQPSMGAALFVMNEPALLGWLAPKDGNLIERLAALQEPAEIAAELYLSVLTRPADGEEAAEVADYLEKNSDRRAAALAELVWALLASAEFRMNH